MKTRAVLVVLGMMALVFAGCQTMRVPGAEITEQGTVLFRAEGTSIIAKEGDPLSIEEAKLAAATIAKANLVEKISGALLTSTVSVDSLMFEKQEVVSTVEGFLARATVTFDGQPKVPEPNLVTAVAELELDRSELSHLERYAE